MHFYNQHLRSDASVEIASNINSIFVGGCQHMHSDFKYNSHMYTVTTSWDTTMYKFAAAGKQGNK